MKGLYLSTGHAVHIGFFDFETKKVFFLKSEVMRSADKIHEIIHDFLQKHNSSMDDIDCLLINNGPGSYTGMRVAEGIAQIAELMKKKIFSFQIHEIVHQLFPASIYCDLAFKNEYFISKKENDKIETNTVTDNSQFDKSNLKRFVGSDKAGSGILFSKFLEENFFKILELAISEDLRQPPLYFRSPEQDFKMAKKVEK